MRRAMRNVAAVALILAGGLIAMGLGVWVWNLMLALASAGQLLGVAL